MDHAIPVDAWQESSHTDPLILTTQLPFQQFTMLFLLQVLNTGRLLKCSQSYAEEHEGLQKQAVAELSRRLQLLDSTVSSASQHQLQWEASQGSALQVAWPCTHKSPDRYPLLQRHLHHSVASCLSNA